MDIAEIKRVITESNGFEYVKAEEFRLLTNFLLQELENKETELKLSQNGWKLMYDELQQENEQLKIFLLTANERIDNITRIIQSNTPLIEQLKQENKRLTKQRDNFGVTLSDIMAVPKSLPNLEPQRQLSVISKKVEESFLRDEVIRSNEL